MKNIFKTLLLLLSAMLVIQSVQGQALLRKMQQKTNRKLDQAIDRKIDEAIDKKIDETLDSIDGGSSSNYEADKAKRDAERDARMARILTGISGEPVPFEDSYSFAHLIQMHVENYKKSGKLDDSGDINMYYSPDSKSMAYEMVSGDLAQQGEGMFIIDAENGAMIILNDENGEKTAIVYGMSAFFQSMGESYNQEDMDFSDSPESYLDNPNVTKTGRTKTVSGYSCEEYKYNDENTESEMWITKDLKMNAQDFFSTLFKTSNYANGMGWGYPMESTSIDKNSGEKSFMQVTKVDKNSNKKFAMNEYQITNLGSFTMPSDEEDIEKK